MGQASFDVEKVPLCAPATSQPRTRRRDIARLAGLLVLAGVCGALLPASPPGPRLADICVQAPVLTPPSSPSLDASLADLNTPAGKNRSAELLSRAVRYDTSSYDDTGPVGDDPRWDVFPPFRHFLRSSFPHVDRLAARDVIHQHALLYTVNGSDANLKPVVLMAHQDVVPVDPATASSWMYPAFSGTIAKGSVWGRGACDCKSQLMAILTALDALLGAGFVPKRTILLSFGFDEETTGFNGAGALAKELERRYGKDGIEMVLDEGGEMGSVDGRPWASVFVGEHGYLDINITVQTPGGHSSLPPEHTSIGLLASLITRIEANPFPATLLFTPSPHPDSAPVAENPYFSSLQCLAAHAPSSLPTSIPSSIAHAPTSAKHRRRLLDWITSRADGSQFKVRTSQAVDVVRGGVKVNALPEIATAVVNFRIDASSSVAEVKSHLLTRSVLPFVDRFGLALDAFDGETSRTRSSAGGKAKLVTVKGFGPLEPAPVSPSTIDDPAWKLLAGTVRQVFGEETVVSPGLEVGNTDTQFYWNLTRRIYRFTPTPDDVGCHNIHTVDERIGIESHAKTVAFYHTLLRNLG